MIKSQTARSEISWKSVRSSNYQKSVALIAKLNSFEAGSIVNSRKSTRSNASALLMKVNLDNIKSKLKGLLKNIDDNKIGEVKSNLFFELVELN